MKRVFWPAGHGAFYWERFCKRDFGKVVNIVYDCGTLSKGCDLERRKENIREIKVWYLQSQKLYEEKMEE